MRLPCIALLLSAPLAAQRLGVTFALNADGTIREARIEPASPTVDFSFDFQDLRLVPRN